jgi:hypothetical protein
MINILLSTITNNYYKKRFKSIERKKDKDDLGFFKKELGSEM